MPRERNSAFRKPNGDEGGARHSMMVAADAAKLHVLPDSCPKCHAGGPWLQRWPTSADCRRCGWTGFLKIQREEDFSAFAETTAEKAQRARKAAWARLKAMTPEQVKAHVEHMNYARLHK